MKGPGLKLDLDVRRLWKCPQTGQTIRLSGNVVAKPIEVDGKAVFMQLVEEKRSQYRDPFHFEYYEPPAHDQSSSERAAAAARSRDEVETLPDDSPVDTLIDTPVDNVADHSITEVASATPSPEAEAVPPTPARAEPPKPAEAEPQKPAEAEEDSFGGGLL
ncbi:hypothetical protein [Gimesia sp.]|uniref:hypothetical protein n=1 Tax=Gimesia sp. TaxID=2024833 RepID=UPI000C3DD142|nr:hypothetical protein [Gimesia sp.]MAX36722.1 hypothetical protein [Gimesia sp.]HBL47019.1 hypothetical protein [Planctomycetaceae bacterium]|tara:strand:+ start:195 stop:677 length:483 start_codon:yes stop_codon:yes gene_type:complete